MTPETATMAIIIKYGQWLLGVSATTIIGVIAFLARRIINTMDRGLVDMGKAVAGVESAINGNETSEGLNARMCSIERRVNRNEQQLEHAIKSVETLTAKLSSQNTELIREINSQGNKASKSIGQVERSQAKIEGMLILLLDRKTDKD